ncbi:MAG: DNA mismatch repair protein MutS [Elusimicrobia bacterium]|nr:DNA mismatch repair protein MutS [Elusimicrobiota bacterium]
MKPEKESLTPLMQQYQAIKQNYKDAILFFRLGDFYEMFGDDALKASPVLEVVLTKRQTVPMCGIPYHSSSSYISKLIKKGFKVAICEQVEEPSQAKGIVKRDVVRLITPGTLVEDNLLDTKKNNYLLAIYPHANIKSKTEEIGIAYLDISTGEFYLTEITDDKTLSKSKLELNRINPSELILPKSLKGSSLEHDLTSLGAVNFIEDWYFENQQAKETLLKTLNANSLKSFGIEDKTLAVSSSGALLKYLEETQKTALPPLRPPKFYSTDEYMLLDNTAIDNLELVENLSTKKRENSLLEIMDNTATSMGSRLMRRYLLQPLTNAEKIKMRQKAVKFFIDEGIMRRQIQDLLKNTGDLERIISRISSGLVMPREIIALKDTLILIPQIKNILTHPQTVIDTSPEIINHIITNLVELPDIVTLVTKCIAENPPADISKGGVIKSGYDNNLDELKKIAHNAKEYLAELEQKERRRTGINSLKIGYTSVFGYYLEITKANLQSVPENYIRKQTLVNAERFITQELKEYEEKVLTAEEKSIRIEQDIFSSLKKTILSESAKLHILSTTIAELDVFISFAKIARENNYCLPEITNAYTIEIKDGRHPVLEKKLIGKSFVPNDTLIDGNENQIILFTGPNMAGKSTYLRQVALITIMAQTGSYTPAAKASIGIVDKIFTRMGASDNLAGGESTFMVEMRETASILHNATQRSLLILDEVGRGTSTSDGISIARAVLEYFSKNRKNGIGPKVLFATHYFELTELAGIVEGIKNYNVCIKEWQDEIVFIHKVVPGPSDKSYGIHVAKLAGLPENVINRAKTILIELETNPSNLYNQPSLFQSPHPLQDEISKIDTDKMTPLEALEIISNWKKRYEK